MNFTLVANLIKQAATVADAADWFGYEYDEEGRHECPTCKGKSTTQQTLALFDEDTRFYCFRCNEGGDVIDWLAAELRMGKGQAIVYLAQRLQISTDGTALPETIRSMFVKKSKDMRATAKRLRAAHEIRRRYWRESKGGVQLLSDAARARFVDAFIDAEVAVLNTPDALPKLNKMLDGYNPANRKQAIGSAKLYRRQIEVQESLTCFESKTVNAFVEARGWPAAAIKRYGIGYGRKIGLLDIDERCGNLSKRGNWIHKDRVTFPIRSAGGRVRAWTSRATQEHQAKWINNANSTIYRKDRALFGLGDHLAQIEKVGFVIIVEGAADAIATAMVARLPYTVAPCGTSFNENHAELVARFVSRAIIITDGDDAGAASAGKTASALRVWGIESQRVTLPDGEDPDTYARDHSPALVRAVKAARACFDTKHRVTQNAFAADTVKRIFADK